MPLTSPTLDMTRVSRRSLKAAVTVLSGLNVDLYLRNAQTPGLDYTFKESRLDSGVFLVSMLPVNSFQLGFAVSRDSSGNLSLPVFAFVDLGQTNSLSGAMRRWWYGNFSLTNKILGGLYINEAPSKVEGKDVVLPYAILYIDAINYDPIMSDIFLEYGTISLVVFAPGAALIDECLDLVQAEFDFKTLPFSSDGFGKDESSLLISPVNREIRSENFRHKDGNLVYRGSVSYDIVIHRFR